MFNMSVIVWWFPILFMIHEMEEIIFIGPWKKGADKGTKKGKKLPYADFRSAETFSVAVLEEYIIIILVTVSAWSSGSYYIWLGLFIGVTIHYLLHIGMSINYGGFVPGVVTSIVIFIISGGLIGYIVNGLGLDILLVVISSVIMTVLFVLNLKILHRLMPWIERQLWRK